MLGILIQYPFRKSFKGVNIAKLMNVINKGGSKDFLKIKSAHRITCLTVRSIQNICAHVQLRKTEKYNLIRPPWSFRIALMRPCMSGWGVSSSYDNKIHFGCHNKSLVYVRLLNIPVENTLVILLISLLKIPLPYYYLRWKPQELGAHMLGAWYDFENFRPATLKYGCQSTRELHSSSRSWLQCQFRCNRHNEMKMQYMPRLDHHLQSEQQLWFQWTDLRLFLFTRQF